MRKLTPFPLERKKLLLLLAAISYIIPVASYGYGSRKSLVGNKIDKNDGPQSSEEDEEHCQRLPPRYSNASESHQYTHFSLVSLLKHGTDVIDQTKYVDKSILILGNTGSGKTTISQILSGKLTSLHAVLTASDRLVIIDDNFKISGPSTKSKTLIPEMVIMEKEGNISDENELEQTTNFDDETGPTIFYDCPGFDDTRGPEEDLAANFFVNHIVRRKVNQVKMLFLVIHSSVKLGNDRLDFDLLATHATKFVKNLTKYRNSIGLVVTKVNSYNARGRYIPDKTIHKEILEFLHLYNATQHEKLSNTKITPEEKNIAKKKIQFAEILLQTNEMGEYNKISFSRDPEKCGPLSESKAVAETRKRIQNLYRKELKFQVANSSDFGYTLKDSTALSIHRVSRNINTEIAVSIRSIITNFESWMERVNIKGNNNLTEILISVENAHAELSELVVNLKTLNNNTNDSSQSPSTLSASINVVDIAKIFKSALRKIGYHVPSRIEYFMEKQQAYIEFFEADDSTKILGTWVKYLAKLRDNYADLRDWYIFCQDLEKKVASYSFHQSKGKGITTTAEHRNASSWLKFLEINTQIPVSSQIKEIARKFGSNSAKEYFDDKLVNIMEFAFRNSEINCISTTAFVTGNFVKVSEFAEALNGNRLCPIVGQIKRLEVYASHTVFIDDDINAEGKELNIVIIAPKWNVIGQRQFNLQGSNAPAVFPLKAKSGRHDFGEDGGNGVPGNPGGAGGSMFGVVGRMENHTNENSLLVNCDGGNGGRGQDGGDGGDGLDGRGTAYGSNYNHRRDINILWIYTKDRIEYNGYSGSPGGNGGYGGAGGQSGIPGKFSLSILQKGPKGSEKIIQASQNSGKTGEAGHPGKGGKGGKPGDALDCSKYRLLVFQWDNCQRASARAESGRDGTSWFNFFNSWGSGSAKSPEYSIVKWQSLSKYKRSFYGSRNQQYRTTQHFLKLIDLNPRIMGDVSFQVQHYVDEFQFLEQYGNTLTSVDSVLSLYINFIEKFERYAVTVFRQMGAEEKKLVKLLSTAACSRLVSMKQASGGMGFVVDIRNYLSNVKEKIEQYSSNNIPESLEEIRRKFEIQLYRKAETLRDSLAVLASHSIGNAAINPAQQLQALERKFAQILNSDMDAGNWGNVIWQLKRGKDVQETLELAQFFQVLPLTLNMLNFLVSGEGNLIYFMASQDIVKNSTWAVQKADELFLQVSKITEEHNESLTWNVNVSSSTTGFNETIRKDATVFLGPKIAESLYTIANEDSTKLSRLEEIVEQIEILASDMHERRILLENDMLSLAVSIKNFLNVEKGQLQESLWTVTKQWQVKRVLQNAKANLRTLADGVSYEVYMKVFDGLQDMLTLTIDLYDDVEQYQNVRRLTAYLTLLHSTFDQRKTKSLKSDLASSQLEKIIEDSVLNREYQRALHAFRQWSFPYYAELYEEKKAPTLLGLNFSFEQMQAFYVAEIEKLRDVLENSSGVFKQTDFYDKPFYIWENSMLQGDIKDLLSGRKVYLKADIMQANRAWNSVKYQLIGLKFKTENRDSGELEKLLRDFRVSMTHGLVSYYKFNDNFYMMTGYENLRIQRGFEHGDSANKTDERSQVAVGDILMSPYTLWTIQLEQIIRNDTNDNHIHATFTDLQRFDKWVNVELVGKGVVVEKGNGLLELDGYYERDKSLRTERFEFGGSSTSNDKETEDDVSEEEYISLEETTPVPN